MENQIESIENQVTEEVQLISEPQVAEGRKITKITINRALIIRVVMVVAVIAVAGLGYYFKGLLVAASVNGSIISRVAVLGELEKASGKSTLESLINKKLIEQEARNKKIVVSADAIDAEITKIEDQIKAQGQTLDQALAAEGMTKDDLKQQIVTKKQLEALLSDKTQVTDAEVAQYIKDSKTVVPKGQEATFNDQARTYLQQQKLSTEAQTLITTLRSQAKINYFIKY